MTSKQYEDFIKSRITELRMEKSISEYRLSKDTGHSKSYMGNLAYREALPSMYDFLTLCEYFKITPMEFFDTKNKSPLMMHELYETFKNYSAEDLKIILEMGKLIQKIKPHQ